MQDLTVARGAFVYAKTQIRRDQWFYAIKEKIIKFGTGLAADLDRIFETRGGDQSYARALALQQSVRADCGAVQKDSRGALSDFFQRLDNGLRGIGRSGKDFEHADLSAFDPDAVGEGAAGIDGDVERVSSWGMGHGGLNGNITTLNKQKVELTGSLILSSFRRGPV